MIKLMIFDINPDCVLSELRWRKEPYLPVLQKVQQSWSPICRRFHQHFMHAFFVRIFLQSQNVTRKSFQKRLSYKKIAQKTLMKLTPEDCCIRLHSWETRCDGTTSWGWCHTCLRCCNTDHHLLWCMG